MLFAAKIFLLLKLMPTSMEVWMKLPIVRHFQELRGFKAVFKEESIMILSQALMFGMLYETQ